MPRKNTNPAAPSTNGHYAFAFDVVETDEERDLILSFLERLNEAAGGDIVTGIGRTAVVRTADKALIMLLGRVNGVQRPKTRKDAEGRSIFSFPMMLPKELTALEELVSAAVTITDGKVDVDSGELVVCQTRSKDLATVLKQYASPIANELVDFGLE